MRKPLQDLDQIHLNDTQKKRTLDFVISKHKHHNRKPVYAAIFAVCCLLLMVNWLLPHSNTGSISSTFAATITFDINPSIEFKLNKSKQVIDIIAYNDDAKRILNQLSLKGKQIEDVVAALLQEQTYTEYLRNGILEVGVYALDEQLTQDLEDTITTYLDQQMDTSQYHCARIDETTYTNAEQHHTSAGKYRVIEQIQQYDSTTSFDDLNRMSMKELYAILETYDITAVPENCQSENAEHGKKGQGKGHHGQSH